MFQYFKNEKLKKIISYVLIIYILLAEMMYAGFGGGISNFQRTSVPKTECIEQVSGIISHTAFVRESSFSYRVDTNVRLTKKKSNGFERTIRVYLMGLFLSILLLVVSLMLLRYTRCVFLVKQRLSVIIYIHNKDGRKGRILSCFQ